MHFLTRWSHFFQPRLAPKKRWKLTVVWYVGISLVLHVYSVIRDMLATALCWYHCRHGFSGARSWPTPCKILFFVDQGHRSGKEIMHKCIRMLYMYVQLSTQKPNRKFSQVATKPTLSGDRTPSWPTPRHLNFALVAQPQAFGISAISHYHDLSVSLELGTCPHTSTFLWQNFPTCCLIYSFLYCKVMHKTHFRSTYPVPKPFPTIAQL